MFQGIKNGWGIIGGSIQAIYHYPCLLGPLLLTWLIYAPTLLYLQFFFPWDKLSTTEWLLCSFLILFFLSFILSVSCFILLKLIEQIEFDGNPNIVTATFSSIPSVIAALPITFVWAILWLIISIIEIIVRRFTGSGDDDEDDDSNFTAENAAKTVAGYEEFSLSSAFFDALKKGVRMIAFLIYPAIAWEKGSIIKAVKRGLGVARNHSTEFATGFAITEMAAVLVFLPPGILFLLSGKFDITFPDRVWYVTIFYCGFAWSFSVLLEQLFTAELYLWSRMWNIECDKAKRAGEILPELHEIRRPSILDNISDIVHLRNANQSDPSD